MLSSDACMQNFCRLYTKLIVKLGFGELGCGRAVGLGFGRAVGLGFGRAVGLRLGQSYGNWELPSDWQCQNFANPMATGSCRRIGIWTHHRILNLKS